MKKFRFKGSLVFALMVCVFFVALYPLSAEDTKPYQLLEDRGIGVLRYDISDLGDHQSPEKKAHLQVINRTSQSLNIGLDGQNGKYDVSIVPKADNKWSINPGEYQFEASVPGFPATRGSISVYVGKSYSLTIKHQ
jgi:hypothetical protein